MLGLDSTLVKHRMFINDGYKPVKQAPQMMSKEIEEKVKERLCSPNIVEWLANIVPVLKAITNAVRCCVDHRNTNGATPIDEYPIPMADLSIDAVAKQSPIFHGWECQL